MPIDQNLIIPTFQTYTGKPGIPVATLVALMNGETLTMPIDQQLIIPTYPTLWGGPGETIEDIVALADGGGGGGIPVTTFATINARSTIRSFWRCNGLAASLGDSGPGGQSLVTIGATPVFQAETPMASEPTTFAIEFDRASNESISLQNLATYDAATGTILFFFKTSTQTGQGVITAQVLNALGIRAFVDGTNARITLEATDSAAGPINFLQSQFTPPVSPIDGDWHLCAIRQPGDGGGPNWFLDGTFYASDAAQVVQALTGTGTRDFWFADSQGAPFQVDDTYIGATAVSSTTFNGRVFNVVWDDALWSDAELTEYWELALAQGLNA